MIVRRRFQRSTSTPAKGAISEVGALLQNVTMPSISGEPVNRYAIQLVANFVSHVPISDVPWPAKNRRKFRWRSARAIRNCLPAMGKRSASVQTVQGRAAVVVAEDLVVPLARGRHADRAHLTHADAVPEPRTAEHE